MSLFIRKAFDITKENIVLPQPLIVFMIIISLSSAGLAHQSEKIVVMLLTVANVLLATAFFSGWFYMIKKAVLNSKTIFDNDEERNKEVISLGKYFFTGVGEYFLPVTLTIVAYVVVFLLILFVSFKLGMLHLPNPGISYEKFMTAANGTPQDIQKFVSSLSFAQLKAINIWMLFIGSITTLYSFITMFIFPAIYEKKENPFYAPFKAFNKSLVTVFKNFLNVILLMMFLMFLNFILSLMSVFFNLNIVLAVIGLVISFYFMTYTMVLLFLYYEEKK